MSSEIEAFLEARYDEDEQRAQLLDESNGGDLFDSGNPCDPTRVLDDLAAKRAILDEHAATWQTVEWAHDQDGKGNALTCRRCQNADHTHWHPPVGQAGVLPEGFVAPYVLAPCRTVLLLAAPFAGHPEFLDEWRAA